MAANSPTPKARTLGIALREARDAVGMGQKELAELVGIHPTVLSKIENGHRAPTTEQTATMLAHLSVNGERRDAIIDLARGTDDPMWLAVSLPEQQQQMEALLNFERTARKIINVSPLLVPGLLQTTNYVRAIMSTAVSTKEVETRTAVRVGRREAITRANPMTFTAVLGECSLRQIIGDKRIMIDQLRHLLDMGERTNIDLRVLPYTSGWHPALEGPFTLIEPEEADPVIHLENRRSGLFLHRPEDVEIYRDAAERVFRVAMSPEDTSGLIAELITQFEEEST